MVVSLPITRERVKYKSAKFPKGGEVPGSHSYGWNINNICFSNIETKETVKLANCTVEEAKKVFHIKDMEVESRNYTLITGSNYNPTNKETGTGSQIAYKENKYLTKLTPSEVAALMNEYV